MEEQGERGLVFIALLVPGPGAREDVVEFGVFGLPAEGGLGELGAGDEAGGVAGAAGFDLDGDGVPGDAAGGFDDLLDGEAGAVAEVADEGCEGVGILGAHLSRR